MWLSNIPAIPARPACSREIEPLIVCTFQRHNFRARGAFLLSGRGAQWRLLKPTLSSEGTTGRECENNRDRSGSLALQDTLTHRETSQNPAEHFWLRIHGIPPSVAFRTPGLLPVDDQVESGLFWPRGSSRVANSTWRLGGKQVLEAILSPCVVYTERLSTSTVGRAEGESRGSMNGMEALTASCSSCGSWPR